MNYSVEYGGPTVRSKEFDINSTDESIQVLKDANSNTSIDHTHHSHSKPHKEPSQSRSPFQQITNDRYNSILFQLHTEHRKNKRYDRPLINHNCQKIEQINNFIDKYSSAIDVYQVEMKRIKDIEEQEVLRQEYIKTWKTLTGYAQKIKSVKLELMKLKAQHNQELQKILELSKLDRKGLYQEEVTLKQTLSELDEQLAKVTR